ncbi:MAG: DUF3843 family protein [Bacteroidales bacterium]
MKKIDSRSWMAIHPYANMGDTDSYYLLVAQEIFQTVESYLCKLPHVSKLEAEWIACCLAAYYEDRTSGINLFRSLNHLHKSLFGTVIPFYRTDSRYEEEDINPADVNFLLWNCLQQIQIYNNQTVVISPSAKEILFLGTKVYTRLKKLNKLGNSGVNHILRAYYYMADVRQMDEVLERIHSLKTRSYLLSTYEDFLRLREDGATASAPTFEEISSPIMLGLYPHQWYAQMESFYRKENSELIYSMEILSLDTYRFDGSSDGEQIFSTLNSDRTIHLNLSKYLDTRKLNPQAHYLHTSLVKFNDMWELIPPVQITRTPECKLRTEGSTEEDRSLYKVTHVKDFAGIFSNNQNILFYASLEELLNAFTDSTIKEVLASHFMGMEETDYVIYRKNKSDIYILRGIARIISSDNNVFYDKKYAVDMLSLFISEATVAMKRILIHMILMNQIVDFYEVSEINGNNHFQDNVQFLSSFLIQHLCNDRS